MVSTAPMTLQPPEADTHLLLQESLDRNRETAWSVARYEQEQSDKLTAQIRFGLTAANAASLVTVLNVSASLKAVDASSSAWSAAFFLVGTVASGYALISQQNSQIQKSGNANARAMTLDRAASLSRYPPHTAQYSELAVANDEAHRFYIKTLKVPYVAIALQHSGAGMWLAGAASIAIPILAAISPPIARAMVWMQHLL